MAMKDIYMKIDEHILRFPSSLPNDEQQFMTYYPYKFPKVMEFYEQKARELYNDPQGYADFVRQEYAVLENAVNKVNEEFQNGNKDDLEFLVEIDRKFNKIFCFKFWVINYIFADGPIHEFYVDQLKAFARKMVGVTDDIEEYEQRIISIQRDLLQTDYADIYLVQALHGVRLMEFLEKDEFSRHIVQDVIPLIDEHNDKNAEKINELWKPIVDKMMDESDDHYSKVRKVPPDLPADAPLLALPPLRLPINQVKMRKTTFPLFSFLNHTVEFRRQNIGLEERYNTMKETIEKIFIEAKNKLSQDEYGDFRLSYEMSKNFSMSKDIMGGVDPVLIPVWERDVHARIFEILSQIHQVRYPSVNHSAMFGSLMWYLPDRLKAKVLSVDNTPFDPENI